MASNGHLTDKELSPASGGTPGPDPGQGQLANEAAAAWNALAKKAREKDGVQICSNGSDSLYRPYSRQVYWRDYWCNQGQCGNAATPGTSNHGWGLAGDVPGFVTELMDKYPEFGWKKECSDAPWEDWHRKYCGTYDGKDPGTGGKEGPKHPVLKKGDKGGAVKRAQKHLRRWNLGLTRPKVDGTFGDDTHKATRDFQICHGLEPDGIIGNKTWKKLENKDHLKDDERSHTNRIKRKRHGGVNKGERDKVRSHRDWCAKRGRSILKKKDELGWNEGRRERFHTMKNMAGDQWEK